MTALMIALLLAVQAEPPARPPSSKEALEKFAKAYKSKDVSERAGAVAELARTLDDKVIAKLGALLVVDDVTVRIAAAKGLSAAAGDQRKKAVTLMSRAFGANAGEPLASSALVESMETMQEGLGYAVAKATLKSPDAPTSRAAAEAMGQIRDKSFVAPLLEHARFLEAAAREATNVGPNGRTVTGGLPGIGGGSAGDPDAPKRAKVLVPVFHKALESISRLSFRTTSEWLEWWRLHEEEFKVPK